MKLKLSGLLVVLLALMPAARAQPVPFKVGISSASVTVFPLWMADAAGLFAKNGLDVQLVNMEGGSRGLQVLLSGDIQVMNVGLSPAVKAIRQGADFKLIASSANTMPFSLYGAPGVTGATDLKGQAVGISTFGSESEVALDLSLEALGLARKDVTVLQVGGNPQRVAAIATGRVKATPLLEPAASLARAQGLKVVVDLVAEKIPWAFDEAWVSESYLKDHRDVLLRFLRAYIEAEHMARADAAQAKALIAKVMKLSDPAVIDASYGDFLRVMPANAEPSQDAVANVLKQLGRMGTEVGSTRPEDYMDASLIADLRKEGFLDALQQRYKVQ